VNFVRDAAGVQVLVVGLGVGIGAGAEITRQAEQTEKLGYNHGYIQFTAPEFVAVTHRWRLFRGFLFCYKN